jgi:hypothetical protein
MWAMKIATMDQAEVGFLFLQPIEHTEESSLDTDAEHHENDHHRCEGEHHRALHGVGQDVRVRAAEHDIDEQDQGSDRECPERRESQHRLEHDEAGDQLTGEVEKEHQRKKRHHHADAVGLVRTGSRRSRSGASKSGRQSRRRRGRGN